MLTESEIEELSINDSDDIKRQIYFSLKQMLLLKHCLRPEVYLSNAHEKMIDMIDWLIMEKWTDQDYIDEAPASLAARLIEDREEMRRISEGEC